MDLRFSSTLSCSSPQKGHLAAVKALLAAKAKVNVRTRKAMTPLHFAAAGGHAEIVAALIRKGADPTATTKQEKTPMDLAKDEGVREAIQMGVSQKAAEAEAGAQKEDAKHKVDAEQLDVKKADAKEAAGGESVDAQAETSFDVKHKQSEESTAEANVVAADTKAPAKTNKAGQSHLRKRRDELETEAGDPVQASEGPASKKKAKVNLSYFDTEGEET
jgi:ankyrin repeat protein